MSATVWYWIGVGIVVLFVLLWIAGVFDRRKKRPDRAPVDMGDVMPPRRHRMYRDERPSIPDDGAAGFLDGHSGAGDIGGSYGGSDDGGGGD